MGLGETALRIVWTILALAIVLALAWFVLRWLNKRVPGTGASGGRMVQVLDRVLVGKNTILLLKVQDKVLLVAMNEHDIEKLCEFDDPEGELRLPEVSEGISFSAALRDAAGKMGLGKKDKDGGEGE